MSGTVSPRSRASGVDSSVVKGLHAIDVAHQVGPRSDQDQHGREKGDNVRDIVAMARHFEDTPYILRFIEFMDVARPTAGKCVVSHRRQGASRRSTPSCRSKRSRPTTLARSRLAGATAMEAARSVSPRASARPAPGNGSPRTDLCTPACSPLRPRPACAAPQRLYRWAAR